MNRTVLSGARILLAFVRRAEMSRDDRVSYDVIYNNKQDRLPKPFCGFCRTIRTGSSLSMKLTSSWRRASSNTVGLNSPTWPQL